MYEAYYWGCIEVDFCFNMLAIGIGKQITRPSFFSEAAGVLLRVCVVACSAGLHHAAGDAQRSSDGGQDGDQRLKNDLPNVLLVHVFSGD